MMNNTCDTSNNILDNSGNSLSHQILNKIDDIKQKLSDNEYKELTELLQKKYKEDKTKYISSFLHEKIVIIYVFYMWLINLLLYRVPKQNHLVKA